MSFRYHIHPMTRHYHLSNISTSLDLHTKQRRSRRTNASPLQHQRRSRRILFFPNRQREAILHHRRFLWLNRILRPACRIYRWPRRQNAPSLRGALSLPRTCQSLNVFEYCSFVSRSVITLPSLHSIMLSRHGESQLVVSTRSSLVLVVQASRLDQAQRTRVSVSRLMTGPDAGRATGSPIPL